MTTKKYADIHVKVDSSIKTGAEDVLKKIGISMSDLINMTLIRVVREKDIPFNTCVLESDFAKMETKEDLEAYLDKLIEEDDGTRYTHDEVWAEMDDYIKMLKVERSRNARLRRPLHA